jgi:N-acetylmuramoyl-L-alanine amidase
VRIIRAGDVGEDVRDVQQRLVALGAPIHPDELDGRFGPSTEDAVRSFQGERRLPVDGLVGPDTWAQLVEAGYAIGDRALYLRHPFVRGDDVRTLQRRLNALGFDAGREDGILGRETDRAIRDFQRNMGQALDGIVGPDTVASLERLRPDLAGLSRAVVREEEELRAQRGSIASAVIAIDPGQDLGDGDPTDPAGFEKREASLRIAQTLDRELDRRGASPLLLRETASNPNPGPSERAALANESGAAACVAIHLGRNADDDPGSSCAFFGTATTYSPAGQRLAELIQQRLCDGLGLRDLGTRRLAISILRETKMPAVQVEPCRVSDPSEEARLRDPVFVAGVAGALADALEEFLGASIEATGTLS